MQKATAWNMPMAIAVAATWSDYTALPMEVNLVRVSERLSCIISYMWSLCSLRSSQEEPLLLVGPRSFLPGAPA